MGNLREYDPRNKHRTRRTKQKMREELLGPPLDTNPLTKRKCRKCDRLLRQDRYFKCSECDKIAHGRTGEKGSSHGTYESAYDWGYSVYDRRVSTNGR